MAGETTTTQAAAIAKTYQPMLEKTFYDGLPILTHFGMQPALDAAATNIIFHYAGNTSAQTYSEGDAAPAPGTESTVQGTVAHNSLQATVKVSGHLKDSMRYGQRYYNALDLAMEGAVNALMHKVEETLMAQFIDAIDDDTSYAGLTRATYGLACAVTDASSAALTMNMLEEAWEDVSIDGRVVDKTDFELYSSAEQLTAYTRAASGLGGNYVYQQLGQGTFDAGRIQSSIAFNGAPWVVLPTLTNTYVFGCRRSDVMIEEARPLTIEPLAKVDDTDTWLLTWRGGLVHKNPKMAFRIESLTT